jgi:hypothetical protein
VRRSRRAGVPVGRRRAACGLAALVAGFVGGVLPLTPLAPAWVAPLASAASPAIPGTVSGRPDDGTLNVANGEVRALAQVGNRIYLGGTFTKLGPARLGAAGVLRTRDRAFAAHFPDVSGVVYAAVADGHGGWYLGGSFTTVGGASRPNLAHVLSSGRVARWSPHPNAPVRALTLTHSGLVVAGDFTTMSGQPARHLVSLALRTGHVRWDAALDDSALSLALSADRRTVYVGGAFTHARLTARPRLLALNARSGRLDRRFHPVVDEPVRALAVDGKNVWLGGDFTSVAGQPHRHLAVVTTSGTPRRSPGTDGAVLALTIDHGHHRVFVAGSFGHVAGLSRPRLAAVSTATGKLGRIHLTHPSGDVRALGISHGSLILAGDFQDSPVKTAPGVLAQIPLNSTAVRHAVPFEAAPASMTRDSRDGGGVYALATGPSGRVLVGGDFSDYGLVTRPHLAAFNADTGALDRTFRPRVDGPIYTLKSTPSGEALFLGGGFHTVDGRARKNLARIGSVRGDLDTAFRADANAFVKDMAVSGNGRLYVAGPFVTLGGAPARHLAALSATTGNLLGGFTMPITRPTNDVSDGVRAIALSPDEQTLAVVGNFRRVGGSDRPLVALINVGVTPAKVRAWRTTLYDTPCGFGRVGRMRDVAFSPDGSQLFIASAGGNNPPACDSVNAFPVVPNHPDVTPQWTARIGDSIETVIAAPGTVYLGGHFRVIDRTTWTDPRYHLAALDSATGRPLSWQPNANGFRGVRELEMGPSGLLAGSDATAFAQLPHGRVAVFAPAHPGLSVRVTGSRAWVPPAGATVGFDVTLSNTSGSALAVNGLTDSHLGSLDGVGTCAVPATIPAGSSYQCHYSARVSGKAGRGVKHTVTASSGGASASDTVKTTMVAGVPTVRLWARTAPIRIPRGGALIRIAVTLTNLDPDSSVVIKTLTSNRWGTLTSACGFPKTVAPNANVWCRLDRHVGGAPRTSVPLRFSATGTVGTNPFSAAGQVDVRVAG